MSGGRIRILSLFTGRKTRKAWNKTREKCMPEQRRQNLAGKDRRSYYKQEEWLEAFLDDKSAFFDSSESDDSNNHDNYDENIEAFVCRFSSKYVFFKNFANFTGKYLCWSLFFKTLLKTYSNTGVFLRNLQTLRTPYFTEHLQWLRTMNINNYLRVLPIFATNQFHQFF